MTGSELGTMMASEMAEQPRALAALAGRAGEIAANVRAALPSRVAGVAFLARGSSDNAALLGRYVVERDHGLPTCLVAPSLATAYRRRPDGFAGWVVVAVSQSGSTPEIVTLSEQFRQGGAVVVGVSNDDNSDLASVSTVAVGLGAGPELAVPATKTVTTQMLAMLAIAAGVGDPLSTDLTGRLPDASRLQDGAESVLSDLDGVRRCIPALEADRLAVVARGLCLAAAKETALKLQETTGIMAHGFSTADFRHGPIAVCGPQVPALLIAGSGPADGDTVALRADLAGRHARSIIVGSGADADVVFPAADGGLECVLATIRGQQFALALSRARGIDPDTPEGLNKVTLTH